MLFCFVKVFAEKKKKKFKKKKKKKNCDVEVRKVMKKYEKKSGLIGGVFFFVNSCDGMYICI